MSDMIEITFDQFGNDYSESDLLDLYRDMLDEVYGTVEVAGFEYDTSRLLENIDDIAFRTGFVDYLDSLVAEGWEERAVPADDYFSADWDGPTYFNNL